MLTRADLLARHCRPMSGSAMSAVQVYEQLDALPEWHLQDGCVARTFRFGNYYETMAFVNALAWMVHREDHHPDLLVGYNRCEVRFNTHSVGGISENDFICAAKTDAIFEQQYGGTAA